MSLLHFLFSFQGRVRRLHFWLFLLAIVVIWGGLLWQFGHWSVTRHGMQATMPHMNGWSSHFGGVYVVTHNPFAGLFALVAVWMKLAVTVKRWHDRDKSGWWVLIILVPVIGGLWQLIECGFLDGTPGPNKYGPSPKGL